MFVHNERKDKGLFEKYEKMFDEVKYFIKVDNNFDNCDEKYMKIRIISNDNLPLKKTLLITMWLYSLDQFLMIKIITTLKYFQNIQFKVKRRNKEYFWVQYDCNNEAINSCGKK